MKMIFSNKGLGAFLAITGIVMFSAKAIMVKLGYRYDVDAVTLLLLRMTFALPVYLFIWFYCYFNGKLGPNSRKSEVRSRKKRIPKSANVNVSYSCIGFSPFITSVSGLPTSDTIYHLSLNSG